MKHRKPATRKNNAQRPGVAARASDRQELLWEEAPDMIAFEVELQRQGHKHVAGLDEAGRGPLAGPVVAAAVVLPAGVRYEGLTDSKLLTSGKREVWFDFIREAALDYAIALVEEGEIDRINILRASCKAMEMAVAGLSLRPDFLLVDGVIPLTTPLPQRCIKKGDRRCQAIAAASILAKVSRDRIMEAYHPQFPHYNFRKNKGYGTREHLKALVQFGACPVHRKSFRGVREVLDATGPRAPLPPLFPDDPSR